MRLKDTRSSGVPYPYNFEIIDRDFTYLAVLRLLSYKEMIRL